MKRYTLFAFAIAAAVFAAAPPRILKINRGMLQQYEDGPPILKGDTVTAGETIHFSFNLEGFTRKEDRISVSYTAQAFDSSDVPLTAALTGKNETTLSPQDKEWQPKLRGSVVLPELLFPGKYKLIIQAKDEISGTVVDVDLPFLIAGAALTATATLEIHSLNFYRDEEAEKPLEIAAYRPGEEIHARFLLTGYGHKKDDGAINVAYGIKLTNFAGKTLFENVDAALDTTAAFYPKPYIPAQLSFSLKPGTPTGEFTLEVSARDAVGAQHASAKRSFRLE